MTTISDHVYGRAVPRKNETFRPVSCICVWAGAWPCPHLDVTGEARRGRGRYGASDWKQGDGDFCRVLD
jgi:hypothetical protein